MRTLIAPALLAPLILVSGDKPAYPYAVAYRPAFRPAVHAVPYHSPAFVGVHPADGGAVRAPGFVPRFTAPVGRPAYAVGSHPLWASRGVYVSRPGGFYRPGYAYYHPYYAGWHHGYWFGWGYTPWLGFGLGVTAGWLLPPWGPVVYWNPYYVVPTGPVVYNYAQPIPVPAPAVVSQSPTDSIPPSTGTIADANAAAGAKLLDDARQAFRMGDYDKAQQLIDKAVVQSPSDSVLHEFRALVLFARQKYQEAAATIYGTLAVGPGWDWQTQRSFYPDTNTYTEQLRRLEDFARRNPNDAAARFLLGYQYLVLDARDAADKMFHSVVALQPKDQLAAHMVQVLEQKPAAERPTPSS
jgi:hypothetical protein